MIVPQYQIPPAAEICSSPAKGILESFVAEDPWFAGYCAVMVNLSDIAAMGGIPIAITNILGTSSEEISAEIWAGMSAASLAYGVPIVGGHTTHLSTGKCSLSAAVLGYGGTSLITSFDARDGDDLAIAIDMRGAYGGENPFWNASTTTPPEDLRSYLALLPLLAEKGLCRAGKDISNGGIIGTLAMLCNCSDVGATLDLAKTPIPADTTWERWLISFPSYGYLLAISGDLMEEAEKIFSGTGITFRKIGSFHAGRGIYLKHGADTERCL